MGQITVGCFHFVQHFSQQFKAAYCGVMYRLLFKVNSFISLVVSGCFGIRNFEFSPSKVGQTNLTVFRLAQSYLFGVN